MILCPVFSALFTGYKLAWDNLVQRSEVFSNCTLETVHICKRNTITMFESSATLHRRNH